MRRLLLSLATVGAVSATAVFATGAFFNDSETSVDNTFTAGDIDLKIDNHSYALDVNIPSITNPQGVLVDNPDNSWELRDLTLAERFFDFADLKPGDYGEDTISVHVGSNDAWMCAAARITEDFDNEFTEPEDEVALPNNDDNDGTNDGDLDSGLQFAFWYDDGDNVLETCTDQGPDCLDEEATIFLSGTLADMGAAGQIALADSGFSILPEGGPVPGGDALEPDFYIGKGWCYGTLTATPLEQDGSGNTISPLNGTGFSCEGSGVGNIGQTDSVVGDLQFYVEQARNNNNFTCSGWTPTWPQSEITVETN